MHKGIALSLLLTLLSACNPSPTVINACPYRLYMPKGLPDKLSTLSYTEEEADYWKDLTLQQELLRIP